MVLENMVMNRLMGLDGYYARNISFISTSPPSKCQHPEAYLVISATLARRRHDSGNRKQLLHEGREAHLMASLVHLISFHVNSRHANLGSIVSCAEALIAGCSSPALRRTGTARASEVKPELANTRCYFPEGKEKLRSASATDLMPPSSNS
jgi:hypothetical protein